MTTMDTDGVALAAIQGLYQMLREKDAEIAAQHEEIHALQAHPAAMAAQMEEVGVLKARLDSLERRDGLRRASAR